MTVILTCLLQSHSYSELAHEHLPRPVSPGYINQNGTQDRQFLFRYVTGVLVRMEWGRPSNAAVYLQWQGWSHPLSYFICRC